MYVQGTLICELGPPVVESAPFKSNKYRKIQRRKEERKEKGKNGEKEEERPEGMLFNII